MWEEVHGGVILNGPASDNYDEDKGVLLPSDWDIKTVDQLWNQAEAIGTPSLDNVNGYHFNTLFAPGKSYRSRVTNVACDT
jgi:hypothetical protein